MTTDEVRKKYIEFFKSSPRNHVEISPAPLVLENDPTTLFTSSGMQPLVPYLMGEKHPEGKRLVDSQPSFRAVDIEEVGDNRHTTFFEMLGNWSLGDYFKKEQLSWVWEFLTKELGLSKEKLWVTVYEGDEKLGVPKDMESVEIWKKLGVPEERIFYYPAEKNWWSRSGTPGRMPPDEIGGPDSEVFFEFTQVKHNPKFGKKCHPNCDCGRFLEIANSVFIQYKKLKDGSLEELPQKNVDFGGGLERTVAATENTPDIFEIDVFKKIISQIEDVIGKSYKDNQAAMRIIADHLRAASFVLASGVKPSNKQQGYLVKRLIRRSVFKLRELDFDIGGGALSTFIRSLKDDYQTISDNWYTIKDELNMEAVKFAKTIDKGLREIKKIIKSGEKVDGEVAFNLYQTNGFPLELTLEILEKEGKKFSEKDKKRFELEFEKHKEKSRTAAAGMFKGGLADKSEETTKLHTATHLLHESLRRVLGEHVSQKGSNITADRLRFDFFHGEKLTKDQLKKVEDMVNKQIAKDLPISQETMTVKEALGGGALGFFGERYGEKVKVYSIGNFSKEICGGPHVASTGKIGHVKITKEESVGAGVRRLYAQISAQ